MMRLACEADGVVRMRMSVDGTTGRKAMRGGYLVAPVARMPMYEILY